MEKVLEYCEQNSERFLDEYKEFLSFESVSADPLRKQEVANCAEWLADHLKQVGIPHVEVIQTQGHPVVFAKHPGPKDAPTILVYGHYDVQPEDPIELWKSPPFSATERDGAIFARGAADDKGQLFLYVKAAEAYLNTQGQLPVNLKLVFEGEEEVGSENLLQLLTNDKERFACDTVVVSDTSMFAEGLPSIIYGLRGLTYIQVDVEAASSDLHSGAFGGTIANPANELVKILSSMFTEGNKVALDGFYDDVAQLSEQERKNFDALPHDDDQFLEDLGAPAPHGEEGYSTIERKWVRPTLDINGIVSGFTGQGAKTVLPNKASAKVSMRLVPHQDPNNIIDSFKKHVQKIAPDSIRITMTPMHAGHPFLCSFDNPLLQKAANALERAYNTEPVYIREGGSIPIVAEFDRILQVPILLIGYSVPNENAHAPNEFFLLENFYKGIRSSVFLMEELAGGDGSG